MTNDITISLSQLVWLIGGLTAIYAFVKAMFKPIKEIEEHDKQLDVMKKQISYIAKAVNALVNHAIDGNGVEKLKNARDEYQNNMLNHNE